MDISIKQNWSKHKVQAGWKDKQPGLLFPVGINPLVEYRQPNVFNSMWRNTTRISPPVGEGIVRELCSVRSCKDSGW